MTEMRTLYPGGVLRGVGLDDIRLQETPTWDPLPDLPQINFTSLYRTGDTFQGALDRLTQDRQVVLPDGFDMDVGGFPVASNSFGFYSNRLLGLLASGPSQARVRLAPESSTPEQQARIPAQGSGGSNPLTIGRIGNGPSKQLRMVCAGFTLEGTAQAPLAINEGRPHNFSGLLSYMLVDSVFQDIKLIGASAGTWNSPPGETFAFNDYKGVRNIYRGIEVDGVTRDGFIMGGSPFGGNNSKDILIEDCFFHGSYVSSLTFSFSGSHTNPAVATSGVTTRRCRIFDNANTVNAAGKRFGIINHENVRGPIRHEYTQMRMRNMFNWNSGHISFANYLADNPDIVILEPDWGFQSAPRNNGCFTVSIGTNYVDQPNRQVSLPLVIKEGRPLTPFHIYGNPSSTLPLNPLEHYVVVH